MVWYLERLSGDQREQWYKSLGRPLDVQSQLQVADEEFDDSYDQINNT